MFCWQSNSHSCLLESAPQASISSEIHTSMSADTRLPRLMLQTSSPFSASYKPWLRPIRALTSQSGEAADMCPCQMRENNSNSVFFLNTMFLHLFEKCLCPRASKCIPTGRPSQVPPIFIFFVSCEALAPTQKLLPIFLLEGPWVTYLTLGQLLRKKTTVGQIIWMFHLLQSLGDSLGHAEMRRGLSVPPSPFQVKEIQTITTIFIHSSL